MSELAEPRGVRLPAFAGRKKSAAKKLTSAEVDIDEMRRTNHISLARVAANGAAPPGAQA